MRATSDRRKAVSRAQSVPVLAPVKHREAGTVVGHIVVHPALHPDHEITADRADALGLVSREQIAHAFGVHASTALRWSHAGNFPAKRATLMVIGLAQPGINADLYDKVEVIAWMREFRPKYVRRAIERRSS